MSKKKCTKRDFGVFFLRLESCYDGKGPPYPILNSAYLYYSNRLFNVTFTDLVSGLYYSKISERIYAMRQEGLSLLRNGIVQISLLNMNEILLLDLRAKMSTDVRFSYVRAITISIEIQMLFVMRVIFRER